MELRWNWKNFYWNWRIPIGIGIENPIENPIGIGIFIGNHIGIPVQELNSKMGMIPE